MPYFIRLILVYGYISVSISAIFGIPGATAANSKFYVSPSCHDVLRDGSSDTPFCTIQEGIEVAQDMDTIIVLEGRYITGSGNRDINFHGKAITVQSRNPHDSSCIQATVIDAEGQGVIARFVNDEGPGTVFSGFTLISGNRSIPVRGVPGFFEFSSRARPSAFSTQS